MRKAKRLLGILLCCVMLISLFPATVLADEPETYGINCIAYNLSGSEAAGTVSLETDIDTYNGAAAFGYATENTDVTINAAANPGYEFVAWRLSAPANPESTFSVNANHTFTATQTVWLYAVFRETPPSAANISINGVDFSGNAYFKNGDTTTFTGDAGNYNAKYDSATGTLELNGFNGGAIKNTSSRQLIINLVGENSIAVSGDIANQEYSGIESTGSLTFTGDGTLTVSVQNEDSASYIYAVQSRNKLIISEDVVLNVTAKDGIYCYGLYGAGGVSIEDSAEVNVATNITKDGAAAYAISAFQGEIDISSTEPVTIDLTGTDNATYTYGILNQAGEAEAANNGDITISGTVDISAAQSAPYAYGIASEAFDTEKSPDGAICLDNANVEITGCDQAILAVSQGRNYDEADIIIENESVLTILSTRENANGIASAANGILIEDSTVSVTTSANGLSTDYSNYSNSSNYGIDIIGDSHVLLTSTEAQGYMLSCKNTTSVCDFDLGPGASVKIVNAAGNSLSSTNKAYIKLGSSTLVNCTEGNQSGTDPDAWTYNGKSDSPLLFTGDVFLTKPAFARTNDEQGTVNFKVFSFTWSEQPILIPAEGDENSNPFAYFNNQNMVQSAIVFSNAVPDGEYRIAVKYGENWYISEAFEIAYISSLAFTTQPQNASIALNAPYYPSWELNFDPDEVIIEVNNQGAWSNFSVNANATGGTVLAQDAGEYLLRVKAVKGSETIYSNEFTAIWGDSYTFAMDPAAADWGTVNKAASYTEKAITVTNTGTKSFYLESGTLAGFNISIDNSNLPVAPGGTTTLRITPAGNIAAGAHDLDLTLRAVEDSVQKWTTDLPVNIIIKEPAFTTIPQNGMVAVNASYDVEFALDTEPSRVELQWWNDYQSKWATKEVLEADATSATVLAEDSATTLTYRIAAIYNYGYEHVVAKEFTVTWEDAAEISDLAATITGFEAGEQVGDVTIAAGDNTYTAEIKAWYQGDNAFNYAEYDELADSAAFTAGTSYVVGVTFTPIAPNSFAGSTNATINGEDGMIGAYANGGKTYYVVLTLEAPTYGINCVAYNLSGNETAGMVSIVTDKGTYDAFGSATQNTQVTINAVANPGYEFVAWKLSSPTAVENFATTANHTFTATGTVWLYAIFQEATIFTAQPSFQVVTPGASGKISFTLNGSYNYSEVQLVKENGAVDDEFSTYHKGVHFQYEGNDYTATEYKGDGIYQTPEGNYKIAAKIGDNWFYSDVFAISYNAATPIITVAFSSANVCGTVGSYNDSQNVTQGQAMTDMVITANDGYYFPENLDVQGAGNGITVTRDSYTQVTISGTPTAGVNIQFGPYAKQKEEAPDYVQFEATGADTGNLTNLEDGVSYTVTGAATAEFTADGTTYALTGVTEGTLNIVKKTTNAYTKYDSDAADLTVGKHATVPNCYGYGCSDVNNNDGKITGVNADMEWQKDGGNSWTAGNGSDITGLTPGTYYVRYKASSINLASNAKTINIAAYNVPALTGTVTITGDALFGEELTATVEGSNNTGALSYQWVRNNSNISGANSETYTLAEADIGCTIKVVVTSSVESGSITSAPTATVEKADGPDAPTGLTGVAPTTAGGADGKITGTTTAMEYSTDSSFTDPVGTVCPDTETLGLTAGTYYVRYKETATHEAGNHAIVTVPVYVAPLTYSITLDKPASYVFQAVAYGYASLTPSDVTVSSTGTGAVGELDIALSGANADSFVLSKNKTASIAADGSDSFTVVPKTGLTPAVYTAEVTVSGANNISESFTVSFTVEKADGPAAPVLTTQKPSLQGLSDGKITGTTNEMEWSAAADFQNAQACTGTEITGLAAGTYYVRVAETATHKAGAAATAVVPAGPAPTYSISIDKPASYVFQGAIYGYASLTPADVTVSSTGTGAVGELDIALSGANADSFVLSKNKTASIAADGSDSFTVAPKTGLTPAVYTAEVTVSGANNISESFTVSFTVEKADGPAAPVLTTQKPSLQGLSDGKITGTTTAMEWSAAADFQNAQACTGTEIIGLAAGTYYVRVAETATHKAGAASTAVVPAGPAPIAGGGGGGAPTSYSITAEQAENGTISVAPKSASQGTTVTITTDPDDGYTLESLTVTDKDGKNIELTDKGDGKYTFKMPAGKVTIKAAFKAANIFTDVFASDYYYDAVLWAVEKGITNGTSEATFSPNQACTRAQMVTFLWRAAGSPEPISDVCSLTDVDMDSYYAKAVLWAVEKGITKGTSETAFSPDANCTRAQMAAFLSRMVGGEAQGTNSKFTDVDADAYYANAVQWAVENGITNGTADDKYSPDDVCTRAQMVTFLYRLLK